MSLEKNTIIGSYKKFNGDQLLIEFKNIYNLYSVYIPEKKNGMVVNMYNLCPGDVCIIFYKWFLNNILSDTTLNSKEKKYMFINWFCNDLKKTYPEFNESNWRVEALKLN